MTIARHHGKPYAVRPLGQLCTWSLGIRNWIKQFQLAAVGRRNLNTASFLHVTSQKEAEEARRLSLRCPVKVFPLGLHVPEKIPNTADQLRAELRIPHGNRIALFLSRLHEGKGLDVLLRAVASAPAKIDLVVCGDGERRYVERMRQLANQIGLASRVHWLGFVTGKRKWQIAQGCDFFVLPSHSENFGIAVVEALACGLFVVVSPQVGIAEEIVRAGLGRLAAIEEKSLADVLQSVALTESFDAESRVARRAFVEERFSWDSAARDLVAAYEEAIHRAI